MNTDGSVQKEVGFTVAGGIVHDQGREWILGFYRHLGNCSVFYVEPWRILDGLIILFERGYDSVLI